MVNAVRLTEPNLLPHLYVALNVLNEGRACKLVWTGVIPMYRVIAVAVGGLILAGCSSSSEFLDGLKPGPTLDTVRFESEPPGAEAKTSNGQSCKTPCSVSVPAAENVTVTFALPKFQPETVHVQVIRQPGDATTPEGVLVDPNPVYAELQPAPPPARRGKAAPKAAPKPRQPAASAAPAASSPFPAPPGR